MLVIEAGTGRLDVPAGLVLDEVQVVPEDVCPGRTPASDHEAGRQKQGLQAGF